MGLRGSRSPHAFAEILGRDALDRAGSFGGKTLGDLLADAAKVAAALPPASPGSEVLLVIKRDRYAAAAAFLGALHRGHAVALAPDGRRESIVAVHERPEVVALVHDTGAGLPLRVEALLEGPSAGAIDALPTGEAAVLTRFGWSEGQLCARRDTAASLEAELSELDERLGRGRFVGALGPHEALAATVLLPLLYGGSFTAVPLSGEALAEEAREGDVLVAPRRVLRALARLPLPSLRLVSPAPLPAALAEELSAHELIALDPAAEEGALEEQLCRLPGVEDAALLLLDGRAYGAVVTAAPISAITETLRALPGCPAALELRATDVIPRHEGGATDAARLLRPFGLDRDGAPLDFRLEFGPIERAEGVVEREVGVPLGYGWFDGHFPGYPILAGAVQLKELVLPFVEEAFPELGPVSAMSRIKFTGRIVPGDRVLVRLTHAAPDGHGGPPLQRGGDGVVSFSIEKAGAACSAGQLSFGGHA